MALLGQAPSQEGAKPGKDRDMPQINRILWIFCTIVSIPAICLGQEAAQTIPALPASQGPPTEFEKQKKALQEDLAHTKELADLRKQIDEVKQKDPTEKLKSDFLGLNFGVGFSLTWDLTDRRIGGGAVTQVNNVVRVEDDSNFFPRFVLESHYFFEGGLVCNKLMGKDTKRCGWGPFVALETGNGSIINGVGVGLMHGFRYDEKSKSSWNLGFGAFVEPRVKVLGDGFAKNQPLPAGETQLRFKDTSLWSIMMLLSFSWNTFSNQ
jgi:hypothetical protein